MAFDFPNAPISGQKYPATPIAGIPTYTWDGEKWTTVGGAVGGGGGGGGAIYVNDTPPVAVPAGSLWWESDTGNMYINFFDGSSTQWVLAVPGGGAQMLAVRYDTAQSLTAGQQSQARANIDVMKKNYVINGAMMVSQEWGSTSGVAGVSEPLGQYYAVDQFYTSYVTVLNLISLQQVASRTPGGSPNRLRATSITAHTTVAANDGQWIQQIIEGNRFEDLKFGTAAAKTITLQFGVKAPAGTYSVAFSGGSPSRNYVGEYTISAGETNTDVVKSITIPGDVVVGAWTRLDIRWSLMVGATYQKSPGAWANTGANSAIGSVNQINFTAVNGNVFELFDVGLYEGSVAPPFQVPDYVTELALCQRYYRKSYNSPAVPGSVANGTGVFFVVNYPAMGTGIQVFFPVMLLPPMRGAPTIKMYSPNSGASGKVFDGNQGVDINASGSNMTDTSFNISIVTGTSNAINMQAHWTANARL